jgi:hypothetical protein
MEPQPVGGADVLEVPLHSTLSTLRQMVADLPNPAFITTLRVAGFCYQTPVASFFDKFDEFRIFKSAMHLPLLLS